MDFNHITLTMVVVGLMLLFYCLYKAIIEPDLGTRIVESRKKYPLLWGRIDYYMYAYTMELDVAIWHIIGDLIDERDGLTETESPRKELIKEISHFKSILKQLNPKHPKL